MDRVHPVPHSRILKGCDLPSPARLGIRANRTKANFWTQLICLICWVRVSFEQGGVGAAWPDRDADMEGESCISADKKLTFVRLCHHALI